MKFNLQNILFGVGIVCLIMLAWVTIMTIFTTFLMNYSFFF